MAERRKVLVVDDDKVWQAFLAASLNHSYEVKAAYDGDEGLSLAREWAPDIVVLDIEMPVKNGFEVCSALKANPQLRDIPVIFLSSKSSLQEKITGFKLGADDYIVKPCDAELLSARITRSTQLYYEKKALDEKAEGAQVLAFEAMNSSADLGRSVRFAERTYVMDSFDKVAEGLFQTMAEFGLETSVMFITESGPLFYSHNGYELSPLEKDMFIAIHNEGRFCDFGSRTFCNFKRASLLVKNMPESNPERYGRIKDTVPWILGTTDGKVGSLDLQLAMTAQHNRVNATIESLTSTLSPLQQLHGQEDVVSAIAIAMSQLDDLREGQYRVQNLLNANNGQPSTELADEIFSSDVDFF